MMEDRIYRAIVWAEENLHEAFSSGDLADIACLSEYHFRRMFMSATGISPGLYIKRRRLTRAAEQLTSGQSRIIDIAMESGFDSQESFTRAFKDMFHTTPAQYRRDGIIKTPLMQPPMNRDHLQHLMEGTITMMPDIRTKEAFSVIGMGNDFIIGKTDSIPALWDQFMQRRTEIQVRGHIDYGVCTKAHDNESTGAFHYTASAETDTNAPLPAGMERVLIPGGTYAVFTHKGHLNQFEKTVEYVWKIWVPKNASRLADGPDFELYDDRFSPETMSGEIEIWVPVKA